MTFGGDKLVKDIKVNDYDAIIFIGGQAMDEYYNNPDILKLVRAANERGKSLAAIETAPGIFANAGIVKGKTIASYPTQRTAIVAAGANWVNTTLAIDGNLITADDYLTARRFAAAVLDSLKHQEN